jgi:DNA-binding protein HU-beta
MVTVHPFLYEIRCHHNITVTPHNLPLATDFGTIFAGVSYPVPGTPVQSFIASITTALSKGEKVTLMGFGSLQTVKTKTRMYRDINSGESKKARGKTIVKFRTGYHLSEKIKIQGCFN